ncbi:MAG: hypothetical protein GY770_26940, partial [Aestuariibacter sp.]|nr:hypothetical protein [Aestuariibacter sp.]
KPEVAQLVLRDLEINLQRNASGTSNWDDLIKQETATSSSDDSPAASADDGEPMKISAAFGGLNIENAAMLWKDAQAGAEYRVSDFDLVTGRITPGTPFSVKMALVVQTDKETDPLTLGFASESVAVDMDAHSINLQGLQLSLNDLALGGHINVRDFTQPAVSFKLVA